MRRESNIQIHFIDDKTDKIVLRQLACHVPRIADEIRFGGVGNERFYKVIRIVWVYDEKEWSGDRVNIGVIDCT